MDSEGVMTKGKKACAGAMAGGELFSPAALGGGEAIYRELARTGMESLPPWEELDEDGRARYCRAALAAGARAAPGGLTMGDVEQAAAEVRAAFAVVDPGAGRTVGAALGAAAKILEERCRRPAPPGGWPPGDGYYEMVNETALRAWRASQPGNPAGAGRAIARALLPLLRAAPPPGADGGGDPDPDAAVKDFGRAVRAAAEEYLERALPKAAERERAVEALNYVLRRLGLGGLKAPEKREG